MVSLKKDIFLITSDSAFKHDFIEELLKSIKLKPIYYEFYQKFNDKFKSKVSIHLNKDLFFISDRYFYYYNFIKDNILEIGLNSDERDYFVNAYNDFKNIVIEVLKKLKLKFKINTIKELEIYRNVNFDNLLNYYSTLENYNLSSFNEDILQLLTSPEIKAFLQQVYLNKTIALETDSIPSYIGKLESLGMISSNYEIYCKETGDLIYKAPNFDAIDSASKAGFKCIICDRLYKDEDIKAVFRCSSLCYEILKSDNWMIEYFIQKLISKFSASKIIYAYNAKDYSKFFLNYKKAISPLIVKKDICTLSNIYILVKELELINSKVAFVFSSKGFNKDVKYYVKQLKQIEGIDILLIDNIEELDANLDKYIKALEEFNIFLTVKDLLVEINSKDLSLKDSLFKFLKLEDKDVLKEDKDMIEQVEDFIVDTHEDIEETEDLQDFDAVDKVDNIEDELTQQQDSEDSLEDVEVLEEIDELEEVNEPEAIQEVEQQETEDQVSEDIQDIIEDENELDEEINAEEEQEEESSEEDIVEDLEELDDENVIIDDIEEEEHRQEDIEEEKVEKQQEENLQDDTLGTQHIESQKEKEVEESETEEEDDDVENLLPIEDSQEDINEEESEEETEEAEEAEEVEEDLDISDIIGEDELSDILDEESEEKSLDNIKDLIIKVEDNLKSSNFAGQETFLTGIYSQLKEESKDASVLLFDSNYLPLYSFSLDKPMKTSVKLGLIYDELNKHFKDELESITLFLDKEYYIHKIQKDNTLFFSVGLVKYIDMEKLHLEDSDISKEEMIDIVISDLKEKLPYKNLSILTKKEFIPILEEGRIDKELLIAIDKVLKAYPKLNISNQVLNNIFVLSINVKDKNYLISFFDKAVMIVELQEDFKIYSDDIYQTILQIKI